MYASARKKFARLLQAVAWTVIMTCAVAASAANPPSGAGTIVFVPAAGSVATANTMQFTAFKAFSGSASKHVMAIGSHVRWYSSDTTIATVSNTGLVTPLQAGTVTITVIAGPFHGSTQLTVTQKVLTSINVTPGNPSLPKGLKEQFTATGTYSDLSTADISNSVIWSSSSAAIAPINGVGLASATSVGGPVTITAQDPSTSVNGTAQFTVGPATLASITVQPDGASLVPGESQQLSATGVYTDNTTANFTNMVSWQSSDITVATIGAATGLSSGVALGGPVTITATDPISNTSGTAQLSVRYGVLTYHNDIARTGQNINETVLTTANVNKTNFGKKFSQPVDGYIYAQPLYLPGRNIPGKGIHNVIYAFTEHDSVYAFDADSNTGVNSTPLWKTSLIPAGGSTVSSGNDTGCGDLVPEIGITSTPVIDPTTDTMYVISKTKESGKFFQRLHALDVNTGAEKFGGPVTITASVSGTGDGSSGGMVAFNPLREFNRTALLLQNGLVYIGWASHCDSGPYHGWVMAYNAATLGQVAVFNTDPNAGLGGIWMGGGGLGGDGTNVFYATGNGTFDVNTGGKDYGDSIMNLGPPASGTFPVASFFTPFNQSSLNGGDTDLGSGGVLLLPTQTGAHPHLLVQVGKEGKVYLVDRDSMGGYCSGCTSDTQVVQEIPGAVGGTWGMSAFWNNNVYFGGSGDAVKVYPFNVGSNGLLATKPSSRSKFSIGFPGPTPSISANGTSNGIVWVIQADAYSGPGAAILHALDATNLNTELYNSNMNTGDSPGGAVKFTVPTIVNGKVYVGTVSQLSVYALH